MNKQIEFRVCQVQGARVTYVNGEWQGARPIVAERVEESLQSCSLEWDYLRAAGDSGWNLVGVAQGIGADPNARIVYLSRERNG